MEEAQLLEPWRIVYKKGKKKADMGEAFLLVEELTEFDDPLTVAWLAVNDKLEGIKLYMNFKAKKPLFSLTKPAGYSFPDPFPADINDVSEACAFASAPPTSKCPCSLLREVVKSRRLCFQTRMFSEPRLLAPSRQAGVAQLSVRSRSGSLQTQGKRRGAGLHSDSTDATYDGHRWPGDPQGGA